MSPWYVIVRKFNIKLSVALCLWIYFIVMKLWPIFLFMICVLLSACGTPTYAQKGVTSTPTADQKMLSQTVPVVNTPTIRLSVSSFVTPSVSPAVTRSVLLSATPALDPVDWKEWPVLPNVDANIRTLYEYGQTLGNDPHAFSIFGDCQSRPDALFGLFETDPAVESALSP